MKNLHKLVWIIAIGALAIASVSCKSLDDALAVDSAIVGKWYTTQSNAKDDGIQGLEYEFKADGTFLRGGNLETDATFTASGGILEWIDTASGSVKSTESYIVDRRELVLNHVSGMIGKFKAGKYYKK